MRQNTEAVDGVNTDQGHFVRVPCSHIQAQASLSDSFLISSILHFLDPNPLVEDYKPFCSVAGKVHERRESDIVVGTSNWETGLASFES